MNPGSVLLSGVLMFEHIGWNDAASDIVHALEATIADKVVTYDFARSDGGSDRGQDFGVRGRHRRPPLSRRFGKLSTPASSPRLDPTKGSSLMASASKSPIHVTVTGAAGQIGYSILFRIASGQLLGEDQPIVLRLLEIEPAMKMLEGVCMEIDDGAFPLVHDIVATSDLKTAFDGTSWALLVGSVPRKAGMERGDLLNVNGGIFKPQGRAIAENADPDVHILVVGNPCNTNCLIARSNAPEVPADRWFAMTRLDENRAKAQLARKAGVLVGDVTNVAIWGNHSATQFPDFANALIGGKRATDVITDTDWLRGDFITTVQKRGAAIIDAGVRPRPPRRPRRQSTPWPASARPRRSATVSRWPSPVTASTAPQRGCSSAFRSPPTGRAAGPSSMVFGTRRLRHRTYRHHDRRVVGRARRGEGIGPHRLENTGEAIPSALLLCGPVSSGSDAVGSRDAVVIGMHRSGTSATANCLAELGLLAPPPGDLINGDLNNERGYWESDKLTKFDESVLRHLGGTWSAPPRSRTGGKRQMTTRCVLSDRGRPNWRWSIAAEPPRVMKDPRLCLTLPLWRRVLPREPVAVLVFRDPLEVALSLQKRNEFPLTLSLALWHRYVRQSLASLVGLPVLVIEYARVLDEPRLWVDDLVRFLNANGITPGADRSDRAAHVLQGELRHNRRSNSEGTVEAEQQPILEILRSRLGSP